MSSNFQKTVLASGLVSPHQWEYCLRLLKHQILSNQSKGETVDEDKILRSILIEQRAITEYQAFQLADGKIKFRLGPYVITDFIGQGGMGQVFKAVHEIMGRECAVKVLPLHRVNDETLAGFKREIRMQAKLDCPYLVRAHDAGQDGSVHYLVTEYVAGMDLRKLVKTRGPLSEEEAAGIIMQAALGLAYAHDEGLIHRDVKPANILVTPESIAKVSDVGLAGFAADLVDDPRAGKIVGTPDFISPEQYSTPLQVNAASDVYSLGCTLYYAVTGKAPFPGGDTASKIRRHLEATPLHPRNFNTNLSEEFVDIIADMMEKDPRKRIQTMAEVAARLEAWVTSEVPIAQTTITRGPWLAPPPPMLDTGAGSDPGALKSLPNRNPAIGEESFQDTSFPSGPTSANHTANQPGLLSTAPPPPQFHLAQESMQDSGQMPRNMLVGMTIAIILPPAMVIGMILGYLLASRV
jgi:eukaryotic-like serine/threonine-protein kinase